MAILRELLFGEIQRNVKTEDIKLLYRGKNEKLIVESVKSFEVKIYCNNFCERIVAKNVIDIYKYIVNAYPETIKNSENIGYDIVLIKPF